MTDKKTMRCQLKKQLLQQSQQDRQFNSAKIVKRVMSLDEWQHASCIGITIARAFEVETRQLIKQAWQTNKQVAVPKCRSATREMDFYLIASFDQLEVVHSGLYEPKTAETVLLEPDEINLLILPGVAFTEQGHRLGFGGGYYDRFLHIYHGNSLALAFECQLQKVVPMEAHDVAVHQIVTEKRLIQCHIGGKNGTK
ncbi:MAG: 5-formyltetrahydrofolate cyclo-ligase [Defluviitaleaceae bacterium]|nr:5-formyltetrahydrofolate cyclo-ligase [Defluviitaleaceae bacterium]